MTASLLIMVLTAFASCGTFKGNAYGTVHKIDPAEITESWQVNISGDRFDLRIQASGDHPVPMNFVNGYDGYNLEIEYRGVTIHQLISSLASDNVILADTPDLPKMDFYYATKYPESGETDNDMARKEMDNSLWPLLSKLFGFSGELKTVEVTTFKATIPDTETVKHLKLPDDVHLHFFDGDKDPFLEMSDYGIQNGFLPNTITGALLHADELDNRQFEDNTNLTGFFPVPQAAWYNTDALMTALADWGIQWEEIRHDRDIWVFTFN